MEMFYNNTKNPKSRTHFVYVSLRLYYKLALKRSSLKKMPYLFFFQFKIDSLEI